MVSIGVTIENGLAFLELVTAGNKVGRFIPIEIDFSYTLTKRNAYVFSKTIPIPKKMRSQPVSGSLEHTKLE